MKCADCQYLKILYMPLRDDNAIWDFGKAHCTKYDLYTDFGYKGKFNKMDCVEEDGTLEQLRGMIFMKRLGIIRKKEDLEEGAENESSNKRKGMSNS